nr:cation:dicarboxylase symporter family transporter [Gemmatimonadales bacterium]
MWRTLRGLSLTWWIFIGMGIGILIGWLAPEFAASLKPLSTLFLRMIKSVVVPIIFGTLVIGIAGHGDDLKRIGRLAIKSLSYFWLMTTVALAIGLIAVNLTRPGVGVILPQPDPGAAIPRPTPTTVGGFLEHIV